MRPLDLLRPERHAESRGRQRPTSPSPSDSTRNLFGVDVTLRHQPGTSGFYQGLVVGSEWYWNSERFDDIEQGIDPDTGEAIFGTQRFQRNGGYAYVEAFLGRRYSLGVRGDYAENIAGPRGAAAHATRPSRPGCPRSSSACACRRTRSTRTGRRRRLSDHPAMDRVPRESQPWLRSSLGSRLGCSASCCSSRRSPRRRRCASSRRCRTSPTWRARSAASASRSSRSPSGSQDPHKVPVKPSFVTKLNRADALIVQGLGLEHAFLPALLEVASNPKILPTGPAYIDASIYIEPLEVPTSQNRVAGRAAPARQSALQSRSGARQADGARDRRGTRPRRSGRRGDATRTASRASTPCSTRRSPSGSSSPRRCAA